MKTVTVYCYNHWQRNVRSDRLLERASLLGCHRTFWEAENTFAMHMHSIPVHCTLKEKGRITLKHLKGHLRLHMCEVCFSACVFPREKMHTSLAWIVYIHGPYHTAMSSLVLLMKALHRRVR